VDQAAVYDRAYWAGFSLPRASDDGPSRALEWSLIALAVLLASAYVFARYLARPLRQLNEAVARVGEGKSPPPLPETGPSEIVNLNRGFNHMLANLQQAEQDRTLLLAGVSHDLRTPLARLRLGVEVETRDDAAREGMVADIEEMDKIIGQFLDFARDDRTAPAELGELNAIVAPLVERYRRAGRDVSFAAGIAAVLLRAARWLESSAAAGQCAALRQEPIRLRRRASTVRSCSRSPTAAGIPADQVDRLAAFTRGELARSGAAPGWKLAIVDRIAIARRDLRVLHAKAAERWPSGIPAGELKGLA
jgi:two-component system osmolarity sensor histidine kinase EnvZ